MSKKPRYPYPVPALIAYLNAMQDSTQDDEHDYTVLANLLTFCHATVAHANELWHTGRFASEEPDLLTYRAIQFGFKRLIPLIIGSTVGGWHELLAYVEHPEHFPWYDPDTDWSCVPPLNQFRPAEDELEEADDAQEIDTEEMMAVEYAVDVPL